jgi:hypothetical protein
MPSVRDVPANFLDERSHSLGLVRKNPLSPGRTRREFPFADDVALLPAHGDAYTISAQDFDKVL